MVKKLVFVINFSKIISEEVIKKLKERLENVDKIPDKLENLFKPLDNSVKVTIEYE